MPSESQREIAATGAVYPHRHLVDAMDAAARRHAEREAMVFVADDGSSRSATFGEFYAEVDRAAAALHRAGVEPGEPLVLALDHSPELLPLFCGAVRLGAVPAIAEYPVGKPADEYAGEIGELARFVEAGAAITTGRLVEPISEIAPDVRWMSLDDIGIGDLPPDAEPPTVPAPEPDDPALLQFSSGTTGARKGVVISHRAVCSNIRSLATMYRLGEGDVFYNWLPLYHDMGLIMSVLSPLTAGCKLVITSPHAWLRRPERMWKAFDRHRVTIVHLPNFAFGYLARAVDLRHLEGLDLSSVRILLNGSEPVRLRTIETFLERYEPYGISAETIKPAYGLAENTVLTSFTPVDSPMVVDWIDRTAFQEERRARPVDAEAPGAISMVSSGRLCPDTEGRIVDDDGEPLGDRRVGELQVRGDSLFDGYLKRPELTRRQFAGSWLRTGDVAYTADGFLFLVGRQKDIVIVGGKNIYPADIEEIANGVPGVYQGRVAAFGLFRPDRDTEGVVVTCELRGEPDEGERREITRTIRRRVAERTEIRLDAVQFVPRRWIRKSSSGKIARAANRRRYLEDYRPDLLSEETGTPAVY